MNRSIIIKHHLRPDQLADFSEPRACATKVVLPINQHSLRSGPSPSSCWEGFIYYKYQLLRMADGLRDLRAGLSAMAPCKKGSRDDHAQIASSRSALGRVLRYGLAEASSALGVYDAACKSLTQRAKADRFQKYFA